MKKNQKFNDKDIIDLIGLLIIFAFLLSYFKPDLLLSRTTTTGGDTASHYYSAYFMKNYLLPHGKVVGWTMGNYGGFPLFQFYFFLPFLVMSLIGYLIPLQVAFKIISVLGIFMLPPAAYISMRVMRYPFPIPAVSAISTLPFLFMEANSMWGGNIPSTLAGEFSYSISLALAVLFFGLLYSEIEKKDNRRYLHLVVLLVLITFTHVYTLLFVVFSSAYFLIQKSWEKSVDKALFLFKIYSISFLLTAFWAIPMVWKLSYTTPFAVVWDIKGILEAYPPVLLPFYLLSVIGLYSAIKKRDDRILYLLFSLFSVFFLYAFSTKLGIVDIRFIPFLQLFPLLIAGYGFGEITHILKGKQLLPIIAVFATIMWVNYNVSFIPAWIKWNYDGFEEKNVWNDFNGANQFLMGSFGDSRVVYEHSELHNSAGSSRVFESLPLFSGRATLEGLYMQSTITSPFIFYIQSEISQVTSCPFPQWPCASFDPDKAAVHLEMFNVGEVVVRTEATKTALKRDSNYELRKSFGPYDIYGLKTNRDRYVVVPEFEPVLIETDRWKEVSYLWFINFDLLQIPLVLTDDAAKAPIDFKNVRRNGSLTDLPKTPVNRSCNISESVSNEEIKINTNCVGLPHIIRISYFPNWMVEGADKIYLVSPSFMLIFPEQENVRIYYGRTFIDSLGILLTILGVLTILFERRISKKSGKLFPEQRLNQFKDFLRKNKLRMFLIVIIFFAAVFIVYSKSAEERRIKDDRFGMELALATKRYTICDYRVKDRSVKEDCYKEVGIATNDYNLCDVRVKTQKLRDECFKEIGIKTGDLNLCMVKIVSPELKTQCIEKIKR